MKYKNIKITPKVFCFSSDIPLPSDFPYQAARPACGKGRPPHMADDGHSAAKFQNAKKYENLSIDLCSILW